jgi:hypothetical protein
MNTLSWTPDELRRIGEAAELRVASYRPDGTLRPYVTIWTVTTGDGVYVRSGHGADNPWFRRAVAAGRGRVQAGGVERDVEFDRQAPDAPAHAGIDAVYHAKYDHFGATVVGTVTGDHATHVTLRLHPLG